ncbi:MAG: hypothetical protein ACODAG_09920 [Myxococcota bacterium]
MLIAAGCGLCGAVWAHQVEPAKCVECPADFCAGAPIMLLWLQMSFSNGPSMSLGLSLDVELRGHWNPDDAARVRRAMFRVVEGSGHGSDPPRT